MITKFTVASMVLICTCATVLACAEPMSAVRAREIALIDRGIKSFKLASERLAKARQLREESEISYKAGRYDRSLEARHAALTELGYKHHDVANPSKGVLPIGITPKSAAAEQGVAAQDSAASAVQPGFVECGSAGTWAAPSP
jgi:hypothetical protein